MNAVELDKLTKSFDGKTNVLDAVSYEIPTGEIFGFLGHNGAGKTTTIRLLNGVLLPTGGQARILGMDMRSDIRQIHRISGVMTESAGLYENLSATDNLRFFAKMQELDEPRMNAQIERLLKLFDLWDVRDKNVKTFSTGMKKKISLAVTLLHHPKILFLDEPTSGLDPEAARNVTDLIQKMAREEDVTVFLCTHQLRYAEEICTLYGFLYGGRLIGFGRMDELLAQKENSITLEIRGKDIPADVNAGKSEGGIYRMAIKTDEDAKRIIDRTIKSGGTIYEARQLHWSLEDLYFAYQNEGKNGKGGNNE